MCAERMQRILMSIVIGVMIFLFNSGFILIGNILGGVIIFMLVAWSFTNYCPSLWMFEKVFGKCDWDKKSE